MAKRSVIALGEALALELAADGILVHTVAPGPIVPVAGLLASSMMPRKYGVRDVYHLPASALAS